MAKNFPNWYRVFPTQFSGIYRQRSHDRKYAGSPTGLPDFGPRINRLALQLSADRDTS